MQSYSKHLTVAVKVTLVLAYSSPALDWLVTNSKENELNISLFSIIIVSLEKMLESNSILPLPLKLAECAYCYGKHNY